MIKRILTLLRLDFSRALRDNLMIYIILAPIGLAVLAKIFIPSLEDYKSVIAIKKNIDSSLKSHLAIYGKLEEFGNEVSLIERVKEFDDVMGVIQKDGKIKVVLEGNEPDAAKEIIHAILLKYSGQTDPNSVSLIEKEGTKKPVFKQYAAIMLIMMAFFLGGMVSAFNIVDEKESKTIRALSTSPIGYMDYIIEKGLFAILIAWVITNATSLVLAGSGINYLQLNITLLIAGLVTLLFTFIIGAMANTQIQALSIIKIVMSVFLTIPIAALFVPDTFQFIFYIMPNYWLLRLLLIVYLETPRFAMGFVPTGLIATVTGLTALALAIPLIRKLKIK